MMMAGRNDNMRFDNFFILLFPEYHPKFVMPNGMRYLRVGGTRERRFAGTNLQSRKRLENAASPTRRVHAVLARTLGLRA